jgi:hypothetical protein
MPDVGGLPTSEELRQPVRTWLESKGNPKCAVCGERWIASLTEDNVALQGVPLMRSTFNLGIWRGPDTQRLSTDRRLTKLGNLLHGFYAGSARAVRITCDNCGNMVLFDAYKIGLLERPH